MDRTGLGSILISRPHLGEYLVARGYIPEVITTHLETLYGRDEHALPLTTVLDHWLSSSETVSEVLSPVDSDLEAVDRDRVLAESRFRAEAKLPEIRRLAGHYLMVRGARVSRVGEEWGVEIVSLCHEAPGQKMPRWVHEVPVRVVVDPRGS